MADISKFNEPKLRRQVLEMVYKGVHPKKVANSLGLDLADIKTFIETDEALEDIIDEEGSIDAYVVKREKAKKKINGLVEALKENGKRILFSDLVDDDDKGELVLELKLMASSESISNAHRLKAIEQLTKMAENPGDKELSSLSSPTLIFQQFNSQIQIAKEEAGQYLRIPACKDFRTKVMEI